MQKVKNILRKLSKLGIYIFMLPLYWLSYIIPKDKNLWIFGAWFGEKYADNSKYLFEYINKNHSEIKAIWLTKNKDTYNLIKNKGFKVYKMFSIMGLIYSLRAKIGVISTGLNDINMYTSGKIKIIQLWHGIPLKKIMFDDKITFRRPTIIKKILFFIFPFLKKNLYYNDSLIIATSNEVQKVLSSAFKVPINQVRVTGYPRNDSFYQKVNTNIPFVKKLLELKQIGKTICIYVPTHRKEGKVNIIQILFSNLEEIDSELKKMNSILLIKLHYYHNKEIRKLIQGKKLTNIIVVDDKLIEQDIYNILKLADILITDYSSVYFDYLLANRPIIFAPFDINEYIKKDREFYYNYDDVTPGPKCKSWNEVLVWIKKFKENPKLYEKERLKIRDIFHTYKDGKSSERVYNEIIKLIS